MTYGRKTNVGLWTMQGLLAAVFLLAGGVKLAMPVEALAMMSPLPGLFLKFIAVCEVTGALGLLLPGIFRVRRELTPLAAAGLVVIMTGATTITAATTDVTGALLPLVVGILAAAVAYGRQGLIPVGPSGARLRPAFGA